MILLALRLLFLRVSFPIITRWGTRLKEVVLYCENFDKIKLFLSQLSESESEAVEKAQKLAKDNDIRNKLYGAHSIKFPS